MILKITLQSQYQGSGYNPGPFNIVANPGGYTFNGISKSELISGKYITVADSVTGGTITSNGYCTNTINWSAPSMITPTPTPTSTSTTGVSPSPTPTSTSTPATGVSPSPTPTSTPTRTTTCYSIGLTNEDSIPHTARYKNNLGIISTQSVSAGTTFNVISNSNNIDYTVYDTTSNNNWDGGTFTTITYTVTSCDSTPTPPSASPTPTNTVTQTKTVTPTSTPLPNSYPNVKYGTTSGSTCSAGGLTVYSFSTPGVGSIIYCNQTLLTPLTGYNYIFIQGLIFTIDSSTGQLLTETSLTCSGQL